ncbi:ribosome-associated translation inhibitor RaiA [Candidatus Saccharibacteria bacterium]|nr:ribosome-associated translation inhibitor RaiA [Candidatus Saccharibacteria bacterium]MBR2989734.1 ribosome-associated translation inhibitor RaiA [Candidatus Saccharibacteria bacterium]
MIDKIEITGNKYKVEESFKKYATKRIGKLDRYLPRSSKKDVVAKIVITEINKAHGNKYELSAAMEIPGGKVLAAKDESSNVYAGIDIIEAKLMGQIRRFKLETTPHLRKNKIKSIFKRG